MEEKIRRLIQWSKGEFQGPLSIHLDPTNKCNTRCKFCWQISHKRKGLVNTRNEIPDERMTKLVKEAKNLGVKEWLISGGGEPLMRRNLTIEVMTQIKKQGMHGDIITNGTLFQEEDIKKIISAGWDRIRFSINGHIPKLHDFLVGKKGSFQIALKNLLLIQKYKNLTGGNTEVGFNTVINSKNYKHFPELIELLNSIGGTVLNVQTIILYSNKEKTWALNKSQRKEFFSIARKSLALAESYGIHTNLGSYLDENLIERSNELSEMDDIIKSDVLKEKNDFSNAYCFEPWYLITIRANGIAGSCRLFGDSGVSLHDKNLKEIWFGEYFNNARKRLSSREIPDYCSKCGANEFIENKRIREVLNGES